MGAPENVRATPVTSIALFVLLVISFIINTVGFGSTSWLAKILDTLDISVSFSWGLWKACGSSTVLSGCNDMRTLPGWFKAVQAMVVIGFLATLVSLLLIGLFVITAKFKSRMIALCLAAACFVTVVCDLIGIAVFRAKMQDGLEYSLMGMVLLVFTKDDISWSFYVTCAGTAMYLVSGILAVVHTIRMRT